MLNSIFKRRTLSIFGMTLIVGACAYLPSAKTIAEQPVILIPLNGPIAHEDAELSGLAWQDDTLILLPQYPDRFGKDDGVLFAIPKSIILDVVDRKSKGPVTPTFIQFFASNLERSIHDFEGYEAIGFSGENVYLTIESGKDENMMGYLVGGKISADQSEMHVDPASLVEIPPPVLIDNRTDESIIVMEDRILTFFEANGKQFNANPVAHVFGLDLSPQGNISFPNLEYRVTDATLGPDGRIWVINKFAPNDTDILPRSDPVAANYGRGNTHKKYPQVERIVALDKGAAGLTLADLPPIPLELIEDVRNWEGLVALDNRGFLLVTDSSPGTMLAFVPLP